MKNISKYKVETDIFVVLILMAIISIISIYSAESILPDHLGNLVYKQIMWYLLGFILVYFIMYLGNDFMFRNMWFLYIIGNILLVCLLLFARPINDAKCWFTIPGIGTFQPSEFMKIILIIVIGNMTNKFRNSKDSFNLKKEFIFLIKIGVIVGIPSILTFLQPDTGVVIIYLLITFIMLFISGLRYRWFIMLFTIILIGISLIIGIYFINADLFVKVFGTDFFLRIDRLLDWSNSSGFQLDKGLSIIGSSGLFGKGIRNIPIYVPEAQTDFIFPVFSSIFGFIGNVILIGILAYFDIRLIMSANKSNKLIDKYIMAGIVGMLIYQQFQNIGMTFGLMPITGITLPFISYGGSSLLSYMIMIGIIFNISNNSIRYTN